MWCIIPCIGQTKVYPEPEKEVSQEKLTLNKASQKPEKLVWFLLN